MVVSTVRTSSVGQSGLVAVGAENNLGSCELPVGPSLIPPCLGHLSFGDGHVKPPYLWGVGERYTVTAEKGSHLALLPLLVENGELFSSEPGASPSGALLVPPAGMVLSQHPGSPLRRGISR